MNTSNMIDVGLIVTVIGFTWRFGQRLGEISETLKHLTEAVNRLVLHPERLVAVETTLGDHERRLERGGL